VQGGHGDDGGPPIREGTVSPPGDDYVFQGRLRQKDEKKKGGRLQPSSSSKLKRNSSIKNRLLVEYLTMKWRGRECMAARWGEGERRGMEPSKTGDTSSSKEKRDFVYAVP